MIRSILEKLVADVLVEMEKSLGKAEAGYDEIPVEVDRFKKGIKPLIDKAEKELKSL